MTTRRIHSFEFNDSAATPLAIKESIVETLSRGLEWGGILTSVAKPFAAFTKAAKVHEVLDLCSGAGRPVRILARAMRESGGTVPRFLLTDMMPHPDAWNALQLEMPEAIAFVPTAVDATAVGAELSARRARLIINALHHFPPETASALLADAVRNKAPIFIAECFERGYRNFLPLVPPLFLAHLANPLLAPRHKLSKALLTWLTPVIAIAGLWDGFVSSMRVYSEAELRGMVAGFGTDYEWTYGTCGFSFGGKGYYFHGMPKQR